MADLTRTNLQALAQIHDGLTRKAVGRLQIRTYDETLRFNLLIVDGRRCFAQWYLPTNRGIDSPTLVLEEREDQPHGLFQVFTDVFTSTWDRAKQW